MINLVQQPNNAIGFAKHITAKVLHIIPQNENLLFYVAVNVSTKCPHKLMDEWNLIILISYDYS